MDFLEENLKIYKAKTPYQYFKISQIDQGAHYFILHLIKLIKNSIVNYNPEQRSD